MSDLTFTPLAMHKALINTIYNTMSKTFQNSLRTRVIYSITGLDIPVESHVI